MSEPVTPSTGLSVLHLFCKPTPLLDGEAVVAAVKAAESAGCQVVAVSMLGHKCDAAFMATHADARELRTLQTALQRAGLDVVDSYVSITEVSEYAKGMPEEMLRVRLYPTLPPNHVEYAMPAWCFYPMSKKREAHANWYTLPFEQRSEHMHEHGKSGRTFAGRIAQYITGSTGLDDYEWGVTLFGVHLDDIKDVVYTMRFDQASAVYADFGPFYVGMVTPVEQLVDTL
jgi:chlorite dismutase